MVSVQPKMFFGNPVVTALIDLIPMPPEVLSSSFSTRDDKRCLPGNILLAGSCSCLGIKYMELKTEWYFVARYGGGEFGEREAASAPRGRYWVGKGLAKVLATVESVASSLATKIAADRASKSFKLLGDLVASILFVWLVKLVCENTTYQKF